MFDFLKYRLVGLVFSLSALALFAGMYFYKGGLTYSVEFTGGTQILFGFKESMKSKELLEVLNEQWPKAESREFSDTQILVRVKEHEGDSRGLADRMVEVIQKSIPNNPVSVERSEVVGPSVGANLRSKSIKAVLLALILMLIYIALRFWSLAFAFGAVFALLHDALMMLGMFLLFGRELSINVIGAILAVLGYSINDTIVIFSRIRENFKKMGGGFNARGCEHQLESDIQAYHVDEYFYSFDCWFNICFGW